MKAVIAKRVETGTADLSEIRALAEAAGYDVRDSLTQTRREDSAYSFGEGKIVELHERVTTSEARAVIIDNRLGPYQIYNIGTELPEGTRVIDRFTLILEIFGQRAQTRKAQLQVELAELRYELPRASAKASLAKRDEHPGFMGLGEYDESRERDIKARISRIRDSLDRIAEDEASWREERRESGFDLVALAGYTNAGKSTLLRRLATELEVHENENVHPDLNKTAESQDMLFTTLGTTTRRSDIDGRAVLVTDTVGFIHQLPHWLVESFKSTLEQVYHADLVLLVVDAAEPIPDIRDKIVTCHDTLYERNRAPIVTVFNKTDQLTESELQERIEAISDLAPNPVAISGKEGTGVERLYERITNELPTRREEKIVMPQSNETMRTVSWIHDHADVLNVQYDEDDVTITFRAQDPIIERARDRAGAIPSALAESD